MGGKELVVFFARVPDKFRFKRGAPDVGRRFNAAMSDWARQTTTLPVTENVLLGGKDELSSC